MKKILSLFTIMLVFVVFTNCEENEITPRISEIDYVSFESDFNINVDPSGSISRDINIYTSTIKNTDRTFNISIDTDLTSAPASAYSIPSTVVVPANTNIGIITLSVNGENINPNGGDTLVLDLNSNNDYFVGESLTINIKAFCPFELEDLVGTWTGTTSYGYPTQMVTSINSSGELEITGIAVGFIENAWGEVITEMKSVVVDVDLDTGLFEIEQTPYMSTTYLGDPQPTYNLVGTGLFTVCSTTSIDLDYDLIQAGTSYTAWLTIANGWPPFEEHNTLP
ncbi:hypothetical protein [Aestuariivivens marinum]|uniref:hypothetical protein n=1 Tax=Aestuariivivens marinum TaxID=2913555 RepID=UPI001F5A1751|nr:hypothetical protein [Aestuariivivens marinum]